MSVGAAFALGFVMGVMVSVVACLVLLGWILGDPYDETD